MLCSLIFFVFQQTKLSFSLSINNENNRLLQPICGWVYTSHATSGYGKHIPSFLTELPKHAYILDVGCGSGRETLVFKNKGYKVDAIDYSEELVKKATQLTGV